MLGLDAALCTNRAQAPLKQKSPVHPKTYSHSAGTSWSSPPGQGLPVAVPPTTPHPAAEQSSPPAELIRSPPDPPHPSAPALAGQGGGTIEDGNSCSLRRIFQNMHMPFFWGGLHRVGFKRPGL